MTSALWKRDFASGLIILLPLLVTAYIIYWLYVRIAGIPLPVNIEPIEVYDYVIYVQSPLRVLLTLLIFVLLVFSIGYMMRTAFGDVVEEAIDGLMNRLPGLRVVYNASKMAVETAVSGADELQQPVKIETWEGVRMTAFKTGQTTKDGRDVLFLPTAPNITSGYVIELESSEYQEIDESVEEALTRVLSAGFGEAEPAMPMGKGDEDFVGSDDGDDAPAGGTTGSDDSGPPAGTSE